MADVWVPDCDLCEDAVASVAEATVVSETIPIEALPRLTLCARHLRSPGMRFSDVIFWSESPGTENS